MAGTGRGYRRLLWRIPAGASAGTVLGEEKAVEDEENTARPISVIETESKLWNARRYICAVLQCSNSNGDVLDDYRLYSMIVNNMACNEDWCIIGEFNKDKIFHTHVLTKTGVRIDSWKRTLMSVWKDIATHPAAIEEWGDGGGLTIDCLKGQTAHKPIAIFQYMCKNPLWMVSNVHRMLQMGFDIIHWDLCARFRTEADKPDIDHANPMVKELLDIIMEKGCKTVEELMKQAPEIIVKHLHKPGISSVIQNCLTFAKCTAGTWNIQKYGAYTPDPAGIHRVLLTQGLNINDFDRDFYVWVTKQHPKRNTFELIGPSNTGKTSFIRGFAQCCPGGEIQNGLTFNFEGLVGMYWGRWDEPMLAPEVADKFKQIAEGQDCHVTVKFKKPTPLKRTPIFITTNFPIWRWCEDQRIMFINRMFSYRFKYDMSNGKFIPRTCERSCQCSSCEISREWQTSPGFASTSRLSSSKRSKTTSEQLVTGDATTESTMASRSMRTGTTSTRSISSAICTESEQSSDCAAGGSTSSTISGIHGSSTKYGSGDTDQRMGHLRTRRSTKQLDGYTITRQPMAGDSGADEQPSCSRSNEGGHPGCDVSLPGMVSMGGTKRKTEEMVLLSDAQINMDGVLESMQIDVPTKDHWMGYLSYLYHKFVSGQQGIDLHCYESPLSESDDD